MKRTCPTTTKTRLNRMKTRSKRMTTSLLTSVPAMDGNQDEVISETVVERPRTRDVPSTGMNSTLFLT